VVTGGDGRPLGTVTSGTHAPTLGRAVALALVERGAVRVGDRVAVDVRGRAAAAVVTPLPFYRRG